jgi:two-component system, chemotaxis family, chemotaxis protein CheY
MSKSSLSVDKNMPILVVDHLPMVRRMVRNCLRQLGFENIQEAEDSQVAAQLLEADPFQLIISDSEMPDMAPAELLSKVRGESHTRDIPVLFVASATAKTGQNEAQLKDSHATFIVKPFTAQQMEKRLHEMLD